MEPAVMPARLPEALRPLFPDYRFADLSWELDRDLVASRALRDWLVRREGAGLAPRRLRSWDLMVGIPRRKVNAWLRDPARAVWVGG